MLARVGFFVVALGLSACAGASRAPAPTPPRPSPIAVAKLEKQPQPPAPPPEHWHFEWLSRDGRRALLRRIDGNARSTFQTRIVDVDTGAPIQDEALEELGKLPSTTIGRKSSEAGELDAMLAAPALGEDLVRGAQIAGAFPFGSFGRFSAAPSGGAIAFNAGDWLYVADKRGHVRKRVADLAAYDPRFTPDGNHLLFRQASGKIDRVLSKYELFVVPADLSQAPRALPGTAGVHDRFVVDGAGRFAVAIASHEPQIKTCAIAVMLRPPFSVKRLACLEGGERLVESVISPKGRWAAMTTLKARANGRGREWRLRVASLESGKVLLDEPAQPGLNIRAISDAGVLVQSREDEAVVVDIPGKTRRTRTVDLGHRAFFRGASEVVYVRGATVAVVDLAEK